MRTAWKAFGRQFRPFVAYVFRRFFADGGLGMAASLTYTTLLSLVPLLTVAFSVLSAFPVFQDARDSLQQALFANLLPEPAQAVRDYLNRFMANTGRLTVAGTVGLGVTSIFLLLTIESTVNALFRARAREALVYRLLVFWALLTLGPLVMALSLSLSGYFLSLAEGTGLASILRSGVMSYVVPSLITAAVLTFFFLIIPNRSIGFLAAFTGAAVAGLLFGLLRIGFGIYIRQFPTYEAIYGAISAVPIFLVWVFCSWTVVLLGAVVTASLSDWLRAGGRPSEAAFSGGRKLVIALAVLRTLHVHARTGGAMPAAALSAAAGYSDRVIEQACTALRDRGYVARASTGGWVLARDLAEVSLFDLFTDLGLALGSGDRGEGWRGRLAEQLGRLRRMQEDAGQISLRALIEEPEEGKTSPRAVDQSVPSRSRRTS